jgi:hypothetical protein
MTNSVNQNNSINLELGVSMSYIFTLKFLDMEVITS